MKRVYITILLVLPIIFFLSCKREINNQTSINGKEKYSDSEIVVIFSTLGKLHNDGLDSIFNELVNNNDLLNSLPNTNEKRELIYSIINKSIHKFINGNLQVANINIDEPLNSLFNETNSNMLFGKDLVTQLTASKNSGIFSEKYFLLINKIDNLININAAEQIYLNLITDNISLLNEDYEKMQFVASVSIAYNSTNYWKNNFNKWNHLLNPNYVKKTMMSAEADPKTDPNKAGTDVGKADVAGIIYGAGIGCGIGAFGGSIILPGAGTVTGCAGMGAVGALTGGLGSSAKKAVDSFVDWLTK